MSNMCFIMRGLPGSGKSMVASRILLSYYQPGMVLSNNSPSAAHSIYTADGFGPGRCVGRIHSTDTYFYDSDGGYNFDPSLLAKNHEENLSSFVRDIDNNVSLLIVDNTNSMTWEWKKYHEAAINAGYITSIVELPHPPAELCFSRNIHGVPLEVIRAMKSRWQPTQ